MKKKRKKKKEKSREGRRRRRKGVWNLDGSKISDLLHAAPHAMESDKNFRSVVYGARWENLGPFQRRMCSYFCLSRCWLFSSLSRHLARRHCLSLASLSPSHPFRWSLSWQSYVVGVVIWKSNPQVTSSSVNARQQQTNN
jgi:hypothetical protein